MLKHIHLREDCSKVCNKKKVPFEVQHLSLAHFKNLAWSGNHLKKNESKVEISNRRNLPKSGYKPNIKFKSLIILLYSGYLLETNSRNLVIFNWYVFHFWLLKPSKNTSFSNFWFLIFLFDEMLPIRKHWLKSIYFFWTNFTNLVRWKGGR